MTVSTILGRDFLSALDLSREETVRVLDLADSVKARPEDFRQRLLGRVMVMLFEKPSLRTRVTFESGMLSLGGSAIYLAPDQVQMGEREPVSDVARNLSRWVHLIVARTYRHSTIRELANEASIPVVNALSDEEHPCQALADFQTIREHFGDTRIRIVFVGDGNNVCHSLLLMGTMLGYEVRVACPAGYEPEPTVVEAARQLALESGGAVVIGNDLAELTEGAEVLYTDVWTSMGQEKEAAQRKRDFEGFQVNQLLVQQASPDVRVMHCLPAHRGEEIAADLIDSPMSVLFDQAENRLHAQKALMLQILGNGVQ